MIEYEHQNHNFRLPWAKDFMIKTGKTPLHGEFYLNTTSGNIVVIAQQHSNKTFNKQIADGLNAAGINTLIINLLTDYEQQLDSNLYNYRFNRELMAERLLHVSRWINKHPRLKKFETTYFSTSIDVIPTLTVASTHSNRINRLITYRGRFDLVENVLGDIKLPVLLLAANSDKFNLFINKLALNNMNCDRTIRFVNQLEHPEPNAKFKELAQIISLWLNRNQIGFEIKQNCSLVSIQNARNFVKNSVPLCKSVLHRI